MVIDKRLNSIKLVASEFKVTIIVLFFLNFQRLVDASCIFNDGQIGQCVKFEECHSAIVLSQKGVNLGFCNLEENTVCCPISRNTQKGRPSRKLSSQGLGNTGTNVEHNFESDPNFQRKKHSVGTNNNGNNHGKKKQNSDYIEEPYKFETPNSFYSESEVTNKPPRRLSRPKNDQNEDSYFVPPGLAKKKPWRDEKTTENDFYYEQVTKKSNRGSNRKNSSKNTTRRPEWQDQRGKGTTEAYDSHNEYENSYNNQRTTPKRNYWNQGVYITTKRPDHYNGGNNYAGNGDEYYSAKPTRLPSNASNFNSDSPTYQQGSQNQDTKRPDRHQSSNSNFENNRPSYQHGSSFDVSRPNNQQVSQNQGNKHPTNQHESNFGSGPSYQQSSNFGGGSWPNYQQGSNFEGNHPNHQGSNFDGNRPSSRPGFQKKRISEQKCEEYSKQVTENITGLPLTTNPDPVIIPVRKCITPQQLIVGGENTTLGEFPHMAAIGFRDRNKKQIAWNCGGTLISEQFVMTAAHCTSTSSGRPVKVRLGEFNLMKNDDGAYPVDYGIAEIIIHPDYKPPSKYNDIALLKLTRKVTFYKHIRPACLYSEETLFVSKAIATGWGRMYYDGGVSDILQKVVLSLVDNNTCNRLYKVNVKTEVLSRGIVGSQLCAGELTGGKDTCQGDSGGPLSITSSKCIHHVIGVTSFGKSCALPNSTGVYTRVSAYIPWIESIVWTEDQV